MISSKVSSAIKLPVVHGIGKGLALNIQPEKQVIKSKVIRAT